MRLRNLILMAVAAGLMFAIYSASAPNAQTAESKKSEEKKDDKKADSKPSDTPSDMRSETQAEHDARMKWWREARFGMFIHWGVYSVPAGTYNGKQYARIGEWLMNEAKIPVDEYVSYTKEFNPTKFDAEKWVALAKEAGMKYIVITAKHHDGFAMYGSKVSDYNIVDATPYHHDPLKDLAAACEKAGIKLGFYYSQSQDWYHPGGDIRPSNGPAGPWDPKQKGDFSKYIDEVAVPQVRELLTKYGPISVLWFDTPSRMTKAEAEKFVPLLKLQPQMIVNNRLGGGFKGDTDTPEQRIPPTGIPGRDWETCMTINTTWGYKSFDHNFKSTSTLLHNLIDIASKGGNYLLNVGPTSEGVIPEEEVERLKEMGQWLKVNGDAIYGTTASPFRHYSFDGRVTTKGSKLYVSVFSWKDGKIRILGLKTPVESAKFLASGEAAKIEKLDPVEIEGASVPAISIKAPEHPDPNATVIELTLAAAPETVDYNAAIQPAGDHSITCVAGDAEIHGKTAHYEAGTTWDCISNWTNSKDYVSWKIDVDAAGTYVPKLLYGCDPQAGGSEAELAAKESSVKFKIEATEAWTKFKTVTLDPITLSTGVQTISVKPVKIAGAGLMNLREVKLELKK